MPLFDVEEQITLSVRIDAPDERAAREAWIKLWQKMPTLPFYFAADDTLIVVKRVEEDNDEPPLYRVTRVAWREGATYPDVTVEGVEV